MQRVFLIAFLVCAAAILAPAQQITPVEDTTDKKSQLTKEISELNTEINKLNEIVQMLEEKNKLKANVEALKKQIQTLQASNSAASESNESEQPNSSRNLSQNSRNANISTPVTNTNNSTALVNSNDNSTPINNSVQTINNGQKNTCLDMELRPESYSNFEKTLCDMAKILVEKKFNNRPVRIELNESKSELQTILLSKVITNDNEEIRKFILDAENARTDKQIGGDSKNAGSTSLVVKGGMPRFFSWAMENGAVDGTRDGTTLTFRVNPLGLLNSFAQPNYINQLLANYNFTLPSVEQESRFTKMLRKLSVGFSFDISRGTDPPTFIGSKQQLSAVSARYEFINKRDPLDERYSKDWRIFAENAGSDFLSKSIAEWNKLTSTASGREKFVNPDIQAWFDNTNSTLSNATVIPRSETDARAIEEIFDILQQEIAKLSGDILKKDETLNDASRILGAASLNYAQERRKLLEKIQSGEVVSLEYTNYREVNAPDMSNLRFIAQKGLSLGMLNWDLSFNASLTFFNKKPSGVGIKRIRDFDFALQMETLLGDFGFGKPTLSFAGRYQRIASDLLDDAGILRPNTKGDVAYGQLKLTVPIFGTGIRLPFSVTFANRSELIKERKVGANFGFTLDFDQLFLRGLPF